MIHSYSFIMCFRLSSFNWEFSAFTTKVRMCDSLWNGQCWLTDFSRNGTARSKPMDVPKDDLLDSCCILVLTHLSLKHVPPRPGTQPVRSPALFGSDTSKQPTKINQGSFPNPNILKVDRTCDPQTPPSTLSIARASDMTAQGNILQHGSQGSVQLIPCQAKMKQRGAAVVPQTKAGRELDKELADMRKRKATLEDLGCCPEMSRADYRQVKCTYALPLFSLLYLARDFSIFFNGF